MLSPHSDCHFYRSQNQDATTENANRILSVVSKCKGSSWRHLRGSSVKLHISHNKQEEHYSSASLWESSTLKKPPKPDRTAWPNHERRPSKEGGTEYLDYSYFFPFYNAQRTWKGFLVLLTLKNFFCSCFSFTLKIKVLPWREGSGANGIKNMHKSGLSTLVRTFG